MSNYYGFNNGRNIGGQTWEADFGVTVKVLPAEMKTRRNQEGTVIQNSPKSWKVKVKPPRGPERVVTQDPVLGANVGSSLRMSHALTLAENWRTYLSQQYGVQF